MLSVKEVQEEHQIICLAQLAKIIWHEHYDPMIGSCQVDYMLEQFQSQEAVHRQIEQQNYRYYLLAVHDTAIGFMGIQPNEGSLFLSKVYILKEERKKGYAKGLFQLAEDFAKKNGLKSIYLTVNRNNVDSIRVYLKCGFKITHEQVTDIGNGYVMDDYIMEKDC